MDEERAEDPQATQNQGDEQKSYETILDQQVHTALHELNRPTGGLLASGLSAGLDIGFSAFAVALVVTLTHGALPEPVVALLRANAYAIGFIFVIFGRSELFTEHTTLAMLPVLDARATLRQLGRLWILVYAANIVGTVLFGGLLAIVGPALGVIEPAALATIATEIVDHPTWVILLSAVLAGWMMGLVSWLVTAGRETISEIFFVWLVTAMIGFGHLHHCIVGSAELATAWFATSAISLADYGRAVGTATIGNIIGGVVFVAVIKYAHATLTEGHRGRGWQNRRRRNQQERLKAAR